jgi:hypothetical protein
MLIFGKLFVVVAVAYDVEAVVRGKYVIEDIVNSFRQQSIGDG